jgi:hypothetical protein
MSSRSSPASLSKLPVELVKRIVDLVAAQDEAWSSNSSALYTEVAGCAQREDVGVVDILPPMAGQGVESLSLCNKALRELCLPYLLKVGSLFPCPASLC